jgi:hypothetical protein
MGTGAEGLAQKPVFMAIAEKVGHGRRGEPVLVRGRMDARLFLRRKTAYAGKMGQAEFMRIGGDAR